MNPSSPFPLQLAPIPAVRSENPAEPVAPLLEGFVDDEVIASIIAMPPSASRIVSHPSDLALSSDESDFAGWAVRGTSPFRIIAEKQELQHARPLPVEEPGLGEPHRGNHRWWIAAVSGGASALVLSLLFINLAGRDGSKSSMVSMTKSMQWIESAVGTFAPARD